MSNLILNKLKFLEEQKALGKFWNISWDLGEILSRLVSEQKPKRVLEIGTSNGFSTLWIAKSIFSDSKIVTIDIDEGRSDLAKSSFVDCNLNNIECLVGEVFEILSEKNFEKFDFIFLDAAQRRYSELLDLILEKGLISEKGMMVCDNVLSHKHLASFLKRVEAEFKDSYVIGKDSGFLVIPFSSTARK